MSNIKLMKSELANLIAAGEVIERPASVVKELVENSIDADAKNIYVGILESGRKKILVRDDGCGMDREDAKMCFLRHASSKIKTEYDLNRISTLGFRGEAIPSIASVSKVVLMTSTGEGEGTKVESVPDSELVVSNYMSRKGTIFEITDLFFNTPARLKYLKSGQVENYQIISVMEKLALGFPDIAFELAIDGKTIFKTSGRGDILEAIQRIYGNDMVKELIYVKEEGYAYSFEGYVSKPELNYSKRYNELLFLNRRPINDYKIMKALEEAYRDYLPPNKYPVAFIYLTIDPTLVDVNVHPTKKEVRISVEAEIASDLSFRTKEALKAKRPLYESEGDEKAMKDLGIFVDDLIEEENKKIEANNPTTDFVRRKEDVTYYQDTLDIEPTYEKTRVSAPVEPSHPVSRPSYSMTSKSYDNIFDNETYSGKLPEMHPIGQVLQTYIVCDSSDGFYLIDQHAAAERINFEKTQALYASNRERVIPLIPIIVELSSKENSNVDEEHLKQLEEVGIIASPFGEKTLKVEEIPAFLAPTDECETVVKDCVHSCLNGEAADPVDLLRLTIANIACKMSIKANRIMSDAEIEGLLKDLAKCVNPANCPHGRPTLIKISKDDVEKIFRRSGF